MLESSQNRCPKMWSVRTPDCILGDCTLFVVIRAIGGNWQLQFSVRIATSSDRSVLDRSNFVGEIGPLGLVKWTPDAKRVVL